MRCINVFAWLGEPVNDGDGEYVQSRDALLSFCCHYPDFPLEAVTETLSNSTQKNKTKKTRLLFHLRAISVWCMFHWKLFSWCLSGFGGSAGGLLAAKCASVHLAKILLSYSRHNSLVFEHMLHFTALYLMIPHRNIFYTDIVESGTITLSCCILRGRIPLTVICGLFAHLLSHFQLAGCQKHTVSKTMQGRLKK